MTISRVFRAPITRPASPLRGVLKRHEPLSQHTSWRVGGPADCFYEPAGVEDLSAFLKTRPELATPDLQLHVMPYALKDVKRRKLHDFPSVSIVGRSQSGTLLIPSIRNGKSSLPA